MRFTHVASANRYARDVVSGKIDACEFVRSACKRHLDDLARESDRSFHYKFDKEKADSTCFFIERQRHVKGIWAGKEIVLEPWQQFIICCLFGWVRKRDGLRRFRQAYVEVPRKNAKSTTAAAIGHKMFAADFEAGAEVYSGATTEKQAWEVFRPARLMAKQNGPYRECFGIEVNAKSLVVVGNGSRFEPIVGNPGDGASPHLAIHDEFHEHKTSEQSDAMGTGMGARTQPLQLWITTAGTNLSGPCYQKRSHVVNVLAGNAIDDELFGIIYTIDREDDWTDPKVWRKANPNFGVSVFEDFLEARRSEAMAQASRQNIIRCKHLNQWLTANTAWMNMVAWRNGKRDMRIEDFIGRDCFLAADLASRVDIAALIYVFPGDGGFDVFGKYYLPKDTVMLPQNQHYQTWALEGRLTATPGASINLDKIEHDIRESGKMFRLVKFGYDPFQATQMVGHLDEEGMECMEIGATVKNFSDPMKAVEAAVLDGRLRHNGDPILEWMMGNVVAHYDAKDNIYPRKEGEQNKIDGPVALIMAMGMAIRHEDESSVYDERGIREL